MTLSDWEFYIVEPAAATNEVLNPSIELATTGYTAVGAGVSIARVTTYQRRGSASLEITTATGVASGVYYGTVNEVSGVARTFSVDVLGTSGQAMRIQICDTSGNMLAETTFTANGHWQRPKITRTGTANATRRLYVVRDAVASTAKFYVDGFYYGTVDGTYLDGDMAGFVPKRRDYCWNGTPHASTSWRSGDTRSGGTLLRIKSYANILSFLGFGMANVQNIAHPMTIDRSSFQGSHAQDRELILNLAFTGTHDTMQANRQTIINAVRPDRCTVQQPLIIRYQGLDATGADASEPIDIYAHYVDGLGNNPDNPGAEIAPVRFEAFSPFVAKAGDAGTVMGFKTSVSNFAEIGYRDTDGQWKAMGTGCNAVVYAIASGPDGSIYAGGDFTTAGGTSIARIAKWNGTAWSAMSSGMNGVVRAIIVGPDGTVYAGGNFTTAGGTSIARIAKWNGTAWSALGTGMDGLVTSLAIGPDGYLYAGGGFTTAGGVTVNNIAKWDGSAWSALGTGITGSVISMVFASNGDLFAAGGITAAGGSAANYIAKWNGTAWSALGSGTNASINAVAIGPNSVLYAGGEFTTAGGASANYIAQWNGTAWSALGSGVNGYVHSLAVDAEGVLYAGGVFTTAGGITMPDRLAAWNSTTWVPADVDVNDASAYITSILRMPDGRLYIGGHWTGSTATSAAVTATNSGGVRAYPILTVTGPGTIYQLKNYTTGKSIYFNGLTLLAGETMTLDLRQARFKFFSSWRGNLSGYIADGSDLDWFLNGGDNNVSLLMLNDTAASSAYLSWQDLFWSVDGSKY